MQFLTLEAKGFVYKLQNPNDSRSKMIGFEPHHTKIFLKIEQDVRTELKKTVYSKLERDELSTYLSVIKKFAT